MPELPDNWIGVAIGVAVLLLVAVIVDRLVLRIVHGAVRRMAASTKATWDDRVIERKVFSRLIHAVPGVMVYYGIGPALGVTASEIADGATTTAFAAGLTQRVALSFIVVTAAMSVTAFLDAVNDIYHESYPEAKSRPIKGYLQVVAIVVYIASGIIAVSLLADRSPVVFLSGLGALTAVVLLVFRDTILSLVASIQIASNDMIRIGDWVEMPQSNANGDVIDIALHTVKIQNWDKTISTIPTHRFISESFKNWRGMSEAGGRRIKRSIAIDMSSVRFLSDDEIERLARYELLKEYMAEKRERLAAYEEEKAPLAEQDVIPEPRHLTNIGTFRAYVLAYLRSLPGIHKGMTLIVRQLAPTPQGLPLEIYCFSRDTAWAHYENLQGDIFDHLIAMMPEFELAPFQEPAGTDFARLPLGVAERAEAPSA